MAEAPAQMYDDDTIVREFGTVIGLDKIRDVRYIIKRLNQDKPSGTRFTDYAAALPALNHDIDKGSVNFMKKGAALNYIGKSPIKAGSFGSIYKSKDEATIYKRITLTSDKEDEDEAKAEIEAKAREIFLEAFIQVVLSCDATYGAHVCKIKGLYRLPTSELLRRTRGDVAAAAAADPSITLYILMEPLHCDMWKMNTDVSVRVGGEIGLREFLPLMIQIATLLAHFKEVYKFSHRDLHAGNIMFRSGDYKNPVLIDFGLSCLTLGDTTYSFVPENVEDPPGLVGQPCHSYDLLILATSLFEYQRAIFDKRCLDVLRQSTLGANGRLLLDDLPSFTHLYNPSSKFHMVYPDRILDEGGELYGAVKPYMPLQHMDPKAFVAFAQTKLVGGGRRTFRRRRSRKRRRRHTYRRFR